MTNHQFDKKNFRLLICCIICIRIFYAGNISAQTQIWYEDFGNTAAGVCDRGTHANGFATLNGVWTVTSQGVNDSAASEWYISATEPGLAAGFCATPGCHANSIYTDRTLHIGNVSNSPNAISGVICPLGDCGAVYDPGGFEQAVETHKRAESPSFSMAGSTTHLLVFNYLEHGDTPMDSDKVVVYFFDGTTWNNIGTPPPTGIPCGSGSYQWERYSISLPVLPATANVQLGFLWENNNGGVGSSPSFAIDSIQIYSVDTLTSITASDTDICANTCIDFIGGDIGSGATYSWIFNGGNPASSNVQNPATICYPSPGTYGVQLIASKPGFSDTVTATIVVNPCSTPVADFSASDTVFCEQTCITFYDGSTNGATGWNWFFPGGVPASSNSPAPPQICYNTPGFYDVTLIAFNSFGSDTITKTAYLYVDTCPLPIADFTSSVTQSCPQHCVSFTDASANGPFTSYLWSFPGAVIDTSSSANPTACYDQEGTYDVSLTVTNQFGSNTIVKTGEVVVVFVANSYVAPDTAMYYGSSYQLYSGIGSSYSWTPIDGLDDPVLPNPLATPSETTTYTVAITDNSGCTSLKEVTVTILHNNNIFVPNTFSPNGDDRNDYLFVRGNNFVKFEFMVFDRWGEKIFETTVPTTGWDGTYKGKELDPGVFTWVVRVSFSDNDLATQSGMVTLVR